MTHINNIPDFFIAGAPKCGTTSLYEWLKVHPDIYMPVKEPSFFSQDLRPVPEKTLPEYLAFFESAKARNALVGEASPKYLYSKPGLQKIAQLNPAARIIVILRNPVDLVISYHGQMLREGMETEADFQLAWNLTKTRRRGKCIPTTCPWPKLLDYPRWGSVGTRLTHLLNIFPDKQVKVLFLDDMIRNPKAVYRDTLSFLELPDYGRDHFPAKNKKSAMRSLKLHQTALIAKRKLSPVVVLLHKLRKGKGLGVLKFINFFNLIPDQYQSSVDTNFKKMLINYFEIEISKVEKRANRNFPSWRK